MPGVKCRPSAAVISILVLAATFAYAYAAQASWQYWGGDANNRRFSNHSCIDFSAGGLTKKWTAPTAKSVVGTPAVCGGAVYFTDQSVVVYKLDAATGKQLWAKAAKTLINGQSAVGIRSAPILSPDCSTMYLTTQWTTGCWLIAMNTANGAVIYTKQFDKQAASRTSMSGTYFNKIIFIGVSSTSEGTLTSGTTFQGTMYALNAADGSQKWATVMCPKGFTGCGLWGSSPAVDVRRNQVCVGTGNNYEIPASVTQCVKNAAGNFAAQRNCVKNVGGPQNYVDAVVCLDLNTGAVKWARGLSGVDLYLPGSYMGLDEDFAQGPIVIHKSNQSQDLIIGTSKGARPVAFNASTGATVWSWNKRLADGGYAMWGSCTNNYYYCVGLYYFNAVQTKGNVFCLDVLTGTVKSSYNAPASVYGPLTCTQNYVFIPLFNKAGSLKVMEITTGKIVGSYDTGNTLFCGPAIVQGVAYMGSGYEYNGGTPGNSFHAVNVPLKGTC